MPALIKKQNYRFSQPKKKKQSHLSTVILLNMMQPSLAQVETLVIQCKYQIYYRFVFLRIPDCRFTQTERQTA